MSSQERCTATLQGRKLSTQLSWLMKGICFAIRNKLKYNAVLGKGELDTHTFKQDK